jgi:hypothetical protein
LPERIGIICFDAGGANQISSYIKDNPGQYIYCLNGPAISIFRRALGITQNLELSRLITQADFVIAGTGWESDFEWEGMREVLKAKKSLIAFIDSWTNYEARFIRNDIKVEPNEIWVSDEHAEVLAKRIFKTTTIRKVENSYFNSMKKQREEINQPSPRQGQEPPRKILFLTQPILDYEKNSQVSIGIDEFDALRIFKQHVNELRGSNYLIRLRPHPSESGNKYRFECFSAEFELSPNPELITDLIWSDYVVGVDSYAMYVADQLGIDTYSVLPESSAIISIPKGRIKQLGVLRLRDALPPI